MKTQSLIWTVLLCATIATGCSGDATSPKPQLISATAEEIQAAIQNSPGKAVLVNVWATWCVPCREEFPDILKLYESYKADGLRLVLVSADFEGQESGVESFLKDHGVEIDTYMKQDGDAGFITTMDEEWSGALPASWVYDAKGNRVSFWEGKATYETFESEVLAVLK